MIKREIKTLSFLCSIFISCSGFCQQKSVMQKGIVRSFRKGISDVLVINLNTEESAITNSEGLFTLEVQLNDLLQFSAIQYVDKEILITDTVLSNHIIFVDLIEDVVQLEEVIITPFNFTGILDLDINQLNVKPVISTESLGLPNSGVQHMTKSERLLFDADSGKYGRFMTAEEKHEVTVTGFLSIGVILNPNKIVNRIFGRTKSLQDKVSIEKRLMLENQIFTMFSRTVISEELKITLIDVDNFLGYCFIQKDFPELSDVKNAFEIWEYLETKSKEFNNDLMIKHY